MKKRDINGRIIRVENRRDLREPIIEQCKECDKATAGLLCKAYVCPSRQWAQGNCLLATHLKVEVKKTKKRVGQQKQKK